MNTQDAPAEGRALPGCSTAVREAQRRLLELRRERGLSDERATAAPRRQAIEDDGILARLLARAPGRPATTTATTTECASSDAFSVGRGRPASEDADSVRAPLPPCPPAPLPATPLRSSFILHPSSLVKLYPDLALAILRTKTSAPGRVWLLLRHADDAGRGAVAQADAARLLTGQGSPLRICGRRQLANLLDLGEGRFWERRAGTIWLRSAARVAAALGVGRLGGSPVAVPLARLTGGIGDVRAHLYASFHSGRQTTDLLSGRPRPRGPIARATLTALSAAAPNSQRAYERRARVGRRAVVALGPPVGAVDEHEVAWRRGRALFHYRDHDGKHGRPGAVYLAWQLPNEYTGPHATLPRGRQKRLNRALADLFHDGMTGNGERRDERPATSDERRVGERDTRYEIRDTSRTRRFYGSAKAAALARHDRERYWRGREGVWHHQEEIRDRKYEIRVRRDAL